MFRSFVLIFSLWFSLANAFFVDDDARIQCSGSPVFVCRKGRDFFDVGALRYEVYLEGGPENATILSESTDYLSLKDYLSAEPSARIESANGGKDRGRVFSPFGEICVKLTTEGKYAFRERLIKPPTSVMNMSLAGILLVFVASKLAKKDWFFYLYCASAGTIFSVALLFVLLANFTNRGETISHVQLGLAGIAQYGAFVYRDLYMQYLDWIVVYLFVVFSLSLCVVHWYVKQPDGSTLLPVAVIDVAAAIIRAFGMYVATIPLASPAYKTLFVVSSAFLPL